MTNFGCRNIEGVIEAIRNRKVIIVTDDANRENEKDFIAAVELTTPEIIYFMTRQGRGLSCEH